MLVQSKNINDITLGKAYSYEAYRDKVLSLAEIGQTSGANQSESLINYTKLNAQRMKRLDKTIHLADEILAIPTDTIKHNWLLITEAWCGDAAQNLPVIQKTAQHLGIELKIFFRDENIPLMDEFLTNGARAIPKLIAFNQSDGNVIGTWGPRPAPAQKYVLEAKSNGVSSDTYNLELQHWYNKDKSVTLQTELLALINA